jgi:hypothetical protein
MAMHTCKNISKVRTSQSGETLLNLKKRKKPTDDLYHLKPG